MNTLRKVVYRMLGKGNQDGGIFVMDAVPNGTTTPLISGSSVRHPTWRRQP